MKVHTASGDILLLPDVGDGAPCRHEVDFIIPEDRPRFSCARCGEVCPVAVLVAPSGPEATP